MSGFAEIVWIEIPLRYTPPVAGMPGTFGIAEAFNKLEKGGCKVLEYRLIHVSGTDWQAVAKIGKPGRKGGQHAADPAQG